MEKIVKNIILGLSIIIISALFIVGCTQIIEDETNDITSSYKEKEKTYEEPKKDFFEQSLDNSGITSDKLEVYDGPEKEVKKVKEAEEKAPEKVEEKPKFINPIAELDESEVKEIIKDQAEEKWGTEYNMIEYEINKQTEAYNQLRNIELNNEITTEIMNNAFEKWEFEFNMVQYEAEKQAEAYNNLYKD